MVIEVHEFTTEGHRLLVEHVLSPAEIADRCGIPRQRISEWRSGRSRPSGEWRIKLEAVGIPAKSWDAPPTRGPRGVAPPVAPAALPSPSAVEAASLDELEAYGVAGLEAVVDTLRELLPSLPPRDKVQALAAAGRLHSVLATLELRTRDAHQAYLAGPEFNDAMRLLSVALPGGAPELRAALGRLGVYLPGPPTVEAQANRAPPKTAVDVERLVEGLVEVKRMADLGEPELADAERVGLCIDIHADQIAGVLVDAPPLAARFLALLSPTDETIISAALERRMALASILARPADVRGEVADLLVSLGHVDAASEVRP